MPRTRIVLALLLFSVGCNSKEKTGDPQPVDAQSEAERAERAGQKDRLASDIASREKEMEALRAKNDAALRALRAAKTDDEIEAANAKARVLQGELEEKKRKLAELRDGAPAPVKRDPKPTK